MEADENETDTDDIIVRAAADGGGADCAAGEMERGRIRRQCAPDSHHQRWLAYDAYLRWR